MKDQYGNCTYLFKGKSLMTNEWICGDLYHYDNCLEGVGIRPYKGIDRQSHVVIPETVSQYIGVVDVHGERVFKNDIREFPNGDKFIVIQEDWLEFGVQFIGDPECEDQARDLYRLADTKLIGNIFDNPELIH